MTDPFFHDDDRQRPAPPTVGESASGWAYDPEATREREGTAPPPGQYSPGAGQQPPPGQYAPGVGQPPPTGPVAGPDFAGAIPPGIEPGGAGGGGGGGRPGGLLVAALLAVVVALGGALAFVLTQGGGDGDADSPSVSSGTVEPRTSDPEPGPSDPDPNNSVVVESTTTSTTSTTSTTTTTTIAPAPGSVGGQAVLVTAVGDILDDEEQAAQVEDLLADGGSQPISTADDVLTLCAAVVVIEEVEASATWFRAGVEIENSGVQRFDPGAAGHCIDDGGAPLAAGTYEVEFTDARDNFSLPAVFTVGAATVEQLIINDSGVPICEFDVAPADASTFFVFEFNPPFAEGDTILIDVPDVDLVGQAVLCDDEILPDFSFSPTVDVIGLADGAVVPNIPPTTPEELFETFGRLESYDRPLSGEEQATAIIDIAINSDVGRIATLDRSLTICSGFIVPGTFDGEMVWEFNEVIIARIAVTDDEQGIVGSCITPGGEAFDTGSYQAYLETPESSSRVQSFTVGRAETLLAFVNDTGSEICEVGFSPLLTRFYSPYFFFDENGDDDPLLPGEQFTIPAPLAEVDIEVRDCAGNQISEVRAVAPTDQLVSLSTGLPA